MSFISILKPILAKRQGWSFHFHHEYRTFICSPQDRESFEIMKERGHNSLNKAYSEDGCTLWLCESKDYDPHWQDCYLETENDVWFISVVDDRHRF